MVFNVTFNNISVISWRAVLLVEETGNVTVTFSRKVIVVFNSDTSLLFLSDFLFVTVSFLFLASILK
jgi:hypothetical protein